MKEERQILKEMIAEILKEFDWSTVRRTMEFLNWTWVAEGGIPSTYALMKYAETLLLRAHDAWKKDGKAIHVKSGGLEATCDDKGNLILHFVVREAMVFRKAYEGKEVES